MFGNAFRQRREDLDEDLNLTPVMNLFVAMIPFLLMSATFFNMSIINASVPTISDAPLEDGQSETIMNVVVRMDERGFFLSGQGENVSEAEVEYVRRFIPKVGQEYRFDFLTNELTSIKSHFPRGKTVILVPETQISYLNIVKAMDASRWSQASLAAMGSNEKKLLYPKVVLSSTVEG